MFKTFRKTRRLRVLTYSLTIAGICLSPLSAISATKETWIPYNVHNAVYETRFPAHHTTRFSSIILDTDRTAISEKMEATLDSNTDTEKTYSIEVSQTLGRPLKEAEIENHISKKAKQYLNAYSSLNTVLHERKDFIAENGMRTTQLHFSHDTPSEGKKHIKISFYHSGITRTVQSVQGSKSAINAYRTRDFFQSFKMYEGHQTHDGDMNTSWTAHTSPLNIFTLYLPEPDGIYITEPPKIHNTGKSEVILTSIYDPFLESTLLYRTYGYRFKVNINNSAAKQVLLKRHLHKHGVTVANGAFKKFGDNGINVLFKPKSSKDNKYAQVGKLYALFDKNYMIVHEFLGAPTVTESDFTRNLVNSAKFHPDRAEALLTKAE